MKKRRRLVLRKRSLSPNNPLHASTYSTSTIVQRDEVQLTSEKLKAYCEPGSGDYHIPRAFDHLKDQSVKKFGERAEHAQRNLQRLWDIAREGVYQHRSSSKIKVPGPGAYDTAYQSNLLTLTTGSSGQKGYSFSRDMRSFDKNAREELRVAIKQKERDYVK